MMIITKDHKDIEDWSWQNNVQNFISDIEGYYLQMSACACFISPLLTKRRHCCVYFHVLSFLPDIFVE
jgi:hypothetical protein